MKKIMLNISLLVSLVAINNTNTYNLLTQQPNYQQRVNSYNQQRQANYQQSYNQRENNLSGWTNSWTGDRATVGNLVENEMSMRYNYNNRDTNPNLNILATNMYQ